MTTTADSPFRHGAGSPFRHGAGVAIPIRAFALGKVRLAGHLSDHARVDLAQRCADAVVTAAGALPVVVVSSDPAVREWAAARALDALDDPGSLDGAADAGREWVASQGGTRVVVAHADLPRARTFDALVRDGASAIVALVPCHRDDGTPVLSVPVSLDFRFAYGPGSFRRHAAEARRVGAALRIVRDPDLAFDVDLPDDVDAARRDRITVTGVDLPRPARVLAIGAHPDDIEFGCGATLAKWAAEGVHCEIFVLTDGSKGTWDADADTAALVTAREHEQRLAATALGVSAVHFGHAVDGELEPTPDTRREVCRVIRAACPDIVLGHDPWKQYRLHPDHDAAGRLVIEGVVAARDAHFFPEAGDPHRPSALLLFEAQEVDHVETAADDAFRAKVDALLAHRSQWRSTMGIDPDATGDDVVRQREAFVRRVTEAMVDVPGPGPHRGEPFKLLDEL